MSALALLTGPDVRSDDLKIERANVDAGVDDLTRFPHGGLPLPGPIGCWTCDLGPFQPLAFSFQPCLVAVGRPWDGIGTAKILTKPA